MERVRRKGGTVVRLALASRSYGMSRALRTSSAVPFVFRVLRFAAHLFAVFPAVVLLVMASYLHVKSPPGQGKKCARGADLQGRGNWLLSPCVSFRRPLTSDCRNAEEYIKSRVIGASVMLVRLYLPGLSRRLQAEVRR